MYVLLFFHDSNKCLKGRRVIDVHRCFSIFSLISLIIFYRTELNGTEKPTDIFGIKNNVHGSFLNL